MREAFGRYGLQEVSLQLEGRYVAPGFAPPPGVMACCLRMEVRLSSPSRQLLAIGQHAKLRLQTKHVWVLEDAVVLAQGRLAALEKAEGKELGQSV